MNLVYRVTVSNVSKVNYGSSSPLLDPASQMCDVETAFLSPSAGDHEELHMTLHFCLVLCINPTPDALTSGSFERVFMP